MSRRILFVVSALYVMTGWAQEMSVNEIKAEPNIIGAVKYADKELDINGHFSSNLDLREKRRIGVGTQVGGGLGIAGVNIEINVDSENTAVAGAGTGQGYGTFQLLWKRSWEGKYFTPYTTAGWSRWYNSDTSDDHKKSLILDRSLSNEQKETGRFGIDFVNLSVGMQYQELSGDWVGTSFFVEFGLLGPLRALAPIPTGAVGAIYYF